MRVIVNAIPTKEDTRSIELFKHAVSSAKRRHRLLGMPIAGYNKQGAYLKYSDGSKVYVK